MKLREMGADEQPREKLLEKGPEALSNAEILAILLRTGTGGTNVLDLARMLLRDADGSLVVLSTYSPERLEVTPGIGPAKAVSLAAAFELGRRFAAEDPTPMVCLSTAHPAKFGGAIARAVGQDIASHPLIDALKGAETRVARLPADTAAVAAFVAENV